MKPESLHAPGSAIHDVVGVCSEFTTAAAFQRERVLTAIDDEQAARVEYHHPARP